MGTTEIMGAAGAAALAVLAGLFVRHKASAIPAPKPLDPADRALVHLIMALGHDPAAVLVQAVRKGPKTGIRVMTRDGRPLRWYRLSELKKLQKDPEFRARFAAARAHG